MIRRLHEQKITINEKMRGGDGSAKLEAILTPEEMYNKGRVFSRIILQSGCSIGYHVHNDEMEVFYVIKGTGEFDDNGTISVISTGDAAYTPSGHGHSIRNVGNEDLEIVALIIYE